MVGQAGASSPGAENGSWELTDPQADPEQLNFWS
jgi:hypothetical protein